VVVGKTLFMGESLMTVCHNYVSVETGWMSAKRGKKCKNEERKFISGNDVVMPLMLPALMFIVYDKWNGCQ
jgi:hypothetical protein